MRALAEQIISSSNCHRLQLLYYFSLPSRTSQVVATPLPRIDEASIESSLKEKEEEKEEGIARKDRPLVN